MSRWVCNKCGKSHEPPCKVSETPDGKPVYSISPVKDTGADAAMRAMLAARGENPRDWEGI